MAEQVDKEKAIGLLVDLLAEQHNVEITYELVRKEPAKETA